MKHFCTKIPEIEDQTMRCHCGWRGLMAVSSWYGSQMAVSQNTVEECPVALAVDGAE